MDTQFFGTVLASQIIVGIFGKTFRMLVKGEFPAKQKCYRKYQQTPGIVFSDKKKRCEHHRIIPVIYPACDAASVFHKPGLKRTEEKNADHIAD